MVTLTSEQLDHLLRVLSSLCFVMGLLGALFLQAVQSGGALLISRLQYVLDRRHRIDMSRKRAERWRRVGERFVRVADSMDRRQEHREVLNE